MIRAVIFDFNGVIADDELLHFELFRDVLAEEGVELTSERYHADYLGFDDRGCFVAALRDAGQTPSLDRVETLILRKAALYASAAETGLRIFPHAAESLNALADRWPLAICSGALLAEIEFALNLIEARERVALIVSAEDTTACKPDPQGYRLALEGLQRLPLGLADLAASDCLVIEDSLAGLAAAKAAGMIAVGITHTYPAGQLTEAGADAVIEGLATFGPEWVVERFG